MGLFDRDGSSLRRCDGNNLLYAIVLVLVIVSQGVTPSAGYFIIDVQWKLGASVSEYNTYGSATLLSLNIPEQTQDIFWTFRAETKTEGCKVRNISVFLQRGGYPIVAPYNVTFPDGFHVNQNHLLEFQIPSSNGSVDANVEFPLPGTWYLAAFMKKYSKNNVSPRIFRKSCSYVMSLETVAKVIEDVFELSTETNHQVDLGRNTNRLYKYRLPQYTIQYSVTVNNCKLTDGNSTKDVSPCPVILSFSEEVTPSPHSTTVNCTKHDTCTHNVTSPIVSKSSYILVTRDTSVSTSKSLSFVLDFSKLECERAFKLENVGYADSTSSSSLYRPSSDSQNLAPAKCITPNSLGKLKVANNDFTGFFALHTFGNLPYKENEIVLSDVHTIAADFYINPLEDGGGTLKVGLGVRQDDSIKTNTTQGYRIEMCIMKSRVPFDTVLEDCPGSAFLSVNTSAEENSRSQVYIPYPEPGRWFLSMHSTCYNINTSHSEKCEVAPVAVFPVVLAPCVEERCGRYGACREFMSGILVYSSCQCYAGYRGYGCTDGSEANSDTVELASTLLLSLSNLFFIPGIIVALRRRFFTEALVYTFNMFFSTFYHACDSSKIYIYCMMKYDTLQYSDFMGSLMSFWFTLIAMARLNPKLRSFLHVFGALCIAVFMNFNRLGFWETIVPILGSLLLVAVTWGIVMYKRRQCFPTKWRYIKFLVPGFLLAFLAVVIYTFLEYESNYMYTHSAWHMLISLSICFLLPPRRPEQKDNNLLVNDQGTRDESRRGLIANISDAGSVGSAESLPYNRGYREPYKDDLVL